MKLRRRRLRSPSLRRAQRAELAAIASQEAHGRHVAAYPGVYDTVTRMLAAGPPRRDRRSSHGTALGLVVDHGSTRFGLRAALARVAPLSYTAIDGGGDPYTATAFEGSFWDSVRAHLRRWLEEDAGI